MIQTYKRIICFIFVIQSLNCYSNIESIPSISKDLDLSHTMWEDQLPINLSYPWEFYWLELYEPKDFEQGIHNHGTIVKETFRPWTQRKGDKEKLPAQGYATYRMILKIQDKNQPKTYSLFYNHLFTSSKLYVNGELLKETGKISKNLDEIVALRSNSVVQINTSENYLDIILQIANNKFYHGGPRSEFLIGSPKQIQFYQLKTLMVEIFIFGLIFGSFVYHLFFYFLNRNQSAFLFFAIICFTFLLRIPLLNSKSYEYFFQILSFDTQTAILHFINILSFLAGNYFLNALFQIRKFTFINYIFRIGASLAFFIPLVDGNIRYYLYLLYLIIFLLLFLFHSIFLLYIDKKDKQSFYLMGIGLFSLAIFCFLAITLNYFGIQGGIYLIFGYLIYVIFQALSLSKFFTHATENRASLEFKLAEENQIALATQRSDLQIMMHDNLGADLTDLKVFLEKKVKNSTSLETINLLSTIQERVSSTIKSLRNQLLYIEDLNLTYENFLTGLNLTLLRRYSDAGREFDFNISDQLSYSLQSVHLKSNNRVYFLDLYYMLYEICTNDLKYGIGESVWRLELIGSTIRIYQTNELQITCDDMDLVLKSVGNRLNSLNGRINSQIKDNYFIAKIFVPYI